MDGQTHCVSPQPQSLLGWLPHLWTQVLFPGRGSEASAPTRNRGWLWMILLPGLLLYPCLFFDLFEPDETRYAEIPREMLARGELVVPYLQGEPYLDKPPLLYWLVMLSYSLFGIHDWAARLVPALAIHGTILLTYWFGRRALGERIAWRAALLLVVAPGLLSMGRLLLIDGVLTLCVTLALFAGFEAIRGQSLSWFWWALAALACGLGLLAKGPVALILVLPPLYAHAWLTSRLSLLRLRALGVFLVLAVGLALPWYTLACLRLPEFPRYFFWEHNVVRFLAPEQHVRGVWFYVPILLLALFPGSLLLVPFLRFLLATSKELAQQRTLVMGFLVLAGGWCVLFFSLASCKLPTYILPALPPLALALGVLLAQDSWVRSPWPGRLASFSFLCLALAHHVFVPFYANYRSPMACPEAIQRLCADPNQPVVCYPRACNSLAFYLKRADLPNYRSKDIEELRALVRRQPRTVILCTHRHSLEGLQQLLPPDVQIVQSVQLDLEDLPAVPPEWMPTIRQWLGETLLGLCDIAVVERRLPPFPLSPPPGRPELCGPPAPPGHSPR